MKRRLLTGMSVLVCLCAYALTAIATVPNIVNYRGRLVDAAGAPVADATYLVKFIIYDAVTGGNLLWNSNYQAVTTAGGLFDYQLGSNSALPLNLVTDNSNLYLGITVGTDPEISPRTAFTSGMYSYYSRMADSSLGSVNASRLGGQLPAHYLDWGQMTNVPAGFADGVDDQGSGDITGVTAGTGLSGGGPSGSVTLGLSPTISQAETFTNTVNLNGTTYFGDSAMYVNSNMVMIGSRSPVTITSLLGMRRSYNDNFSHYGVNLWRFINTGSGGLVGVSSSVGQSNSQGPGELNAVIGSAGISGADGATGAAYGVRGSADNNNTSANPRYGIHGLAGQPSNTSGYSYGIYAAARGGAGSTAFGVYGMAAGAGTLYSGYFNGNVWVGGTLTKPAGSFTIDHPLDPANKYLQHSFVESPDMMNVYNGNVITDANGEATITMPDYFESLNRDFRYQLTAIGAPGPNLYIADEISGSTFRIAGADPGMKVSWQVTGIRQDAYANAHRIEVEVDKPANEKGLYMHPVEHGLSETLQLHYEQNKKAQEPPPDTRGQ